MNRELCYRCPFWEGYLSTGKGMSPNTQSNTLMMVSLETREICATQAPPNPSSPSHIHTQYTYNLPQHSYIQGCIIFCCSGNTEDSLEAERKAEIRDMVSEYELQVVEGLQGLDGGQGMNYSSEPVPDFSDGFIMGADQVI